MTEKRFATVQRTLFLALIGNILSFILKMFFGFLANSIAMIADAVHSAFDSLSSVVGLYGNKISLKPPDVGHPYGHRKFEQIAAIAITIMMFIACFNIVHEAIERAIFNIVPNITFYSVASMMASMVISLSISIYERRIGKSTGSIILTADAFHTVTDVLASVVVVIGFIGIRIGVRYADSFAATVVCLLIAFVGYSIFRQATDTLVDRGITLDALSKIKSTVNGMNKGIECHSLRGKTVGDKIYVDMHVTLKGGTSVERAHEITEIIEGKLRKTVEGLEEVIIHVEPEAKEKRH